MDKLHSFYCGKAWRELSHRLKIERGGKCERCGFIAVSKEEWSRLIGHHKTELSDANVDDPRISLEPENVEIICLDCHNKEHKRFGNNKQVFIVWGSPCSGKTTAVRDMIKHGDIALDMDELWKAVTMQPQYIKPNNCRFNIFGLRDKLLDQIKTRYGQWYTAYIIGGYPDKYERERLAQSVGAELVYCESTIEECLERRRKSGRPETWDIYIAEWWTTHERTSRCG